jgi:hypothetical protein
MQVTKWGSASGQLKVFEDISRKLQATSFKFFLEVILQFQLQASSY